jgi:sugar O-acyltransferase (sialic acid O-acetyltransferase NeuD family)
MWKIDHSSQGSPVNPMRSKKLEMPKVLLIGSSHHASVLVDAIELSEIYSIVGYLDDTQKPGTVCRGYRILGGVADARRIVSDLGIQNAVVAIGDNWWRRKICLDLARSCPDLSFPVVRHPSAIIARTAEIGRGSVVLAGSVVGPNSRVGDFCIINTGSSLDHECTMKKFASIAPGVVMGGLVKIGECSVIGVGASISDRISIGDHSIVGTGSAVVRDVPDLVVAYGNPAKTRRSREKDEKYIG